MPLDTGSTGGPRLKAHFPSKIPEGGGYVRQRRLECSHLPSPRGGRRARGLRSRAPALLALATALLLKTPSLATASSYRYELQLAAKQLATASELTRAPVHDARARVAGASSSSPCRELLRGFGKGAAMGRFL